LPPSVFTVIPSASFSASRLGAFSIACLSARLDCRPDGDAVGDPDHPGRAVNVTVLPSMMVAVFGSSLHYDLRLRSRLLVAAALAAASSSTSCSRFVSTA